MHVLGVPLDEDPFAKTEGVRMLPGSGSRSASPSRESVKRPKSREGGEGGGGGGKRPKSREAQGARRPKSRGTTRAHHIVDDDVFHSADEGEEEGQGGAVQPVPEKNAGEVGPGTGTVTPPIVAGEEGDDKDRLSDFLGEPQLLKHLLEFLSFYDWCLILSLSRAVRHLLVQNVVLRETVLERFLRTVGYSRWTWADRDPLSLSLQACVFHCSHAYVPHRLLVSGPQRLYEGSVHPDVRVCTHRGAICALPYDPP